MYLAHAKALCGVSTSYMEDLEKRGKQIRKQKSKNQLKKVRNIFQTRNNMNEKEK